MTKGKLIKVAYVTSCREIGLDEGVGKFVVDPETGAALGYRKGLLEELVNVIGGGQEDIWGLLRLSLVICDDGPDELQSVWAHNQLWPSNLTVRSGGNDLCDVTSMPLMSIFRSVSSKEYRCATRTAGESQELFSQRRTAIKQDFETALVSQLDACKVDVVIVDSLMTILGTTTISNYERRIINIHLGITDPDHPGVALGPTPTRDVYTRARYGFVIIDDKVRSCHPRGSVISVDFEGKKRTAVRVPKIAYSGVTAHYIVEGIDRGPILASRSYTFDPENSTIETIRRDNYRLKLQVLKEALHEHVTHATSKTRLRL